MGFHLTPIPFQEFTSMLADQANQLSGALIWI
jgi:hypothetical protein